MVVVQEDEAGDREVKAGGMDKVLVKEDADRVLVKDVDVDVDVDVAVADQLHMIRLHL